jgi:hypothetical protein
MQAGLTQPGWRRVNSTPITCQSTKNITTHNNGHRRSQRRIRREKFSLLGATYPTIVCLNERIQIAHSLQVHNEDGLAIQFICLFNIRMQSYEKHFLRNNLNCRIFVGKHMYILCPLAHQYVTSSMIVPLIFQHTYILRIGIFWAIFSEQNTSNSFDKD